MLVVLQHSSDRPSTRPPGIAAVHADALVLPGTLYGVPAAHGVHAAAPDAEYVFAGHAVHDVASGLVSPGYSLLQPAALCRPAGQSAQALQWRPITSSRTSPVPSSVQGQYSWLPTWYWPAPHPSCP